MMRPLAHPDRPVGTIWHRIIAALLALALVVVGFAQVEAQARLSLSDDMCLTLVDPAGPANDTTLDGRLACCDACLCGASAGPMSPPAVPAYAPTAFASVACRRIRARHLRPRASRTRTARGPPVRARAAASAMRPGW
jgi:hypothetical protein